MSNRETHKVVGYGFHGQVNITFRGPAVKFRLSPSQERRYWQEVCGVSGCMCSGRIEWPSDGACVELDEEGNVWLIPEQHAAS